MERILLKTAGPGSPFPVLSSCSGGDLTACCLQRAQTWVMTKSSFFFLPTPGGPCSACNTSSSHFLSSQPLCGLEASLIFFPSQMRQLRNREAKSRSQGHTASGWLNRDYTAGLLLLGTSLRCLPNIIPFAFCFYFNCDAMMRCMKIMTAWFFISRWQRGRIIPQRVN